jgi:hypothetical protein
MNTHTQFTISAYGLGREQLAQVRQALSGQECRVFARPTIRDALEQPAVLAIIDTCAMGAATWEKLQRYIAGRQPDDFIMPLILLGPDIDEQLLTENMRCFPNVETLLLHIESIFPKTCQNGGSPFFGTL